MSGSSFKTRDGSSVKMQQSDNPTSPTSPIAPYPPEYRSRAPEFYGFVAWTSTSFLYVVYLLWALLPDEWIKWLGVEWYPSREWAILVPAYSVVVALLTYFVYFALALLATPSFSDSSAITDSRALWPPLKHGGPNPYLAYANPNQVPEIYDLPIGLVNRVAYGPWTSRNTSFQTE
ncbi:PIG-P domain-containing protein [Mycena indigotica]|uniref:PIG-P domain-containing protein n=1 Tax=Mycena indigotica TaxID=2126181 RepID=A0A8H6TEA9_9AGAR|nr:PIG-P domain-containing protein [Mycena indigotica]KAF7316118.1 PIG-P domain-containing protein [Mycena indigotica]